MIHDSTPHRIFKISELTRLIAGHLILIDPEGAVNLACTCRYLEEPVLSTLWEIQYSLGILLGVLPEAIWVPEYWMGDYVGDTIRIEGEPSPESWNIVRRYSSWMREVRVDELDPTEEVLSRLNSLAGWFPVLQDLSWGCTESNLPYANLFFSPHLERVSIHTPCPTTGFKDPPKFRATIASTFSTLPVSTLQSLSVEICFVTDSADFKDFPSSLVLRCGSSLTKFTSTIPLSNTAVNHLVHLPRLRTWHVKGSPPNYSASSLPLAFPPLEEFTSEGDAAHKWLSLFGPLEDNVLTVQGVTPLHKMKNSLKTLKIEDTFGPAINISSISSIQVFHNLINLNVWGHDEDREDRCTFGLNNDNVTELAMALPRLESLLLGRPCAKNICSTNVACLLPISVHCVKLQKLQVHFNTTNIVGDLKNISEDPRFQELWSLPKCVLSHLDVWRIPLTLNEFSLKIVADGMIAIFPSLECCPGLGGGPQGMLGWRELSEKIAGLREMRTLPVCRQ